MIKLLQNKEFVVDILEEIIEYKVSMEYSRAFPRGIRTFFGRENILYLFQGITSIRVLTLGKHLLWGHEGVKSTHIQRHVRQDWRFWSLYKDEGASNQLRGVR